MDRRDFLKSLAVGGGLKFLPGFGGECTASWTTQHADIVDNTRFQFVINKWS